MSLENKAQLNKKIQEKKVVISELESLKKGVKVYKQQQNSNIYFKADKGKVFREAKGALDDLLLQYQEIEKSGQAEGEEAESGEEEAESEN